MAIDPARVKALFQAAIELTDPGERRAFLDREAGGDAELRTRLGALLAAHQQPPGPLDQPLGDDLPLMTAAGPVDPRHLLPSSSELNSAETTAERPSQNRRGDEAPALLDAVIAGRYKLRQVIGEGGMGTVYFAEQIQPVRRQVALKLIRAGMDSRTVLARFESERQALALMDHPNIARVLDAGTTESGHPFFVMELVKGIPLTDFCDQHRLDMPTRLNLFRQVCSAVQHAHQKGIIHRDLKPSNILVEDHAGTPVPKVIDFGLAKATSGLSLTEASLFTAFGTIAGTPLYMAPEQATFNSLDVDTRADIYALGVILYELLTGTTPIRKESLQRAALDEVMRVIREEEAQVPSHRISTSEALPSVAATRPVEPIRLGRFVRGDLDWIVMKALAKDRSRRYDSAVGLANDIERFLKDEPVTAGPPTARYRTAKFIRRHRGQVVAASLIVLALIGGTIGTTLGLVRARAEAAARQRALIAEAEQRREAERQGAVAHAEAAAKEQARQLAERRLAQVSKMNEVLGSIFGDLDVGQAEKEGKPLAAVLGDRLDQAAAALEGEAIGDPLAVARLQATLGRSQFNLGFLRRAVDLYERSIAALARLLGPSHPETLAVMSRLGVVYIWVGQNDRAVSLNERALEGLRASLGPDHPETLAGVRRLAHAYYGSGRSDRAIPLLERKRPVKPALPRWLSCWVGTLPPTQEPAHGTPQRPQPRTPLATTPPATVHQWPVHLRLLCSGRRFLDLVPSLEATNGRSVPSPTPAANPVRPAPPRPRSTPGRPATFPGRRDRTAPPDPTPLRFPAPTPMAGTPGRRTRQPPTPGGHAMIMLPSAVRIFLCTRPTDMRKSFDGLTGLVQECFAHDPLTGHLFLFVNRRKDRIKILYFDRDGLAIWYKRLEAGSFQKPPTAQGDGVELQATQLALILAGIDINSVRQRKRYQHVGSIPKNPEKIRLDRLE